MDEENVHKLEGTSSSSAVGGLVIRKKTDSKSPRPPQVSKFGLDRLAAEKREEDARLRSFKENEHDDQDVADGDFKKPALKRQYREPQAETPTYTGGVSSKARDRLREHENRERDKRRHESSTGKDRGAGKVRRRHRDEDDRRSSRRSDRRDHRGRESIRSVVTPYRDEPRSGRLGASSWDDDDDEKDFKRHSAWDYPTPKSYSDKRSGEWSERSHRLR